MLLNMNCSITSNGAVPWLRRLVAGLLPRRPGFAPQVNPCGVCGVQSGTGTGFSEFFGFPMSIYCNEFAGSVSQWKFITLKVQYTTINYNTSNTRPTSARPISSRSSPRLGCWSSSFYGNAFCYIVVWNTLVFIVIRTQLFSLLRDRTVTLLWNCNNFALSIVTATLTLLGQGNLTYATPPRKPNM
jgi:hypothetical protein